jgi:hypothetical protein
MAPVRLVDHDEDREPRLLRRHEPTNEATYFEVE